MKPVKATELLLAIIKFNTSFSNIMNEEAENRSHTQTAYDILSIQGDFFEIYRFMPSVEEIHSAIAIKNFDDVFNPKTFIKDEKDLPTLVLEYTDLYKKLIISWLEHYCDNNHPSSLAKKQAIDELLNDINSLNHEQYERDRILDKYLSDKATGSIYTIIDFELQCEESVNYCMQLLDNVWNELFDGTNNFSQILPDDFSYEDFYIQALRSVAYLCHNIQAINTQLTQLKSLNDYDIKNCDKNQIELEKLELKKQYDLASETLEELKQLVEKITNKIKPDRFTKKVDADIEIVTKLRTTLSIIDFYCSNETTRFTFAALTDQNDPEPNSANVVTAMFALKDLYRHNSNAQAPNTALHSSHSVKNTVKYFLELSDSLLNYFIDLEHFDLLDDSSGNPTPLKWIIEKHADPQSTSFQHFCELTIQSESRYKLKAIKEVDNELVSFEDLIFLTEDEIDDQANRYIAEIQPDFVGPPRLPALFISPN